MNQFQKSSFIFEFSGMPKSGKSTVIELVSNYLRRRGFRALVHSDNGTYAPISKDHIGALNIYLGAQASQHILEVGYAENDGFIISLMDRGLFDRCVFSETLKRRGQIPDDEDRSMKSFFTDNRFTTLIDHVFVFDTEVSDCVRRETLNSLHDAPGAVMNDSFLSDFRSAIHSVIEHYSHRFGGISVINTSQLDNRIRDVARLVAVEIETQLLKSQDTAPYFNVKVENDEGSTIVVAPGIDKKPMPYVIQHKGNIYYRYMERLYHLKKPDFMNPKDAAELCDVRADLIDEIVDFDLNRKLVEAASEYTKNKLSDRENIRILDFGCGTGLSTDLLSECLSSKAEKIIGLDISEKAKNLCSSKGHEAFIYKSGLKMDLPHTDYDVIFSFFVMHFDIPSEDLKSLHENSKDSAFFIFNLYNCGVDHVTPRLLDAGWGSPQEIQFQSRRSNHKLFVSFKV